MLDVAETQFQGLSVPATVSADDNPASAGFFMVKRQQLSGVVIKN